MQRTWSPRRHAKCDFSGWSYFYDNVIGLEIITKFDFDTGTHASFTFQRTLLSLINEIMSQQSWEMWLKLTSTKSQNVDNHIILGETIS